MKDINENIYLNVHLFVVNKYRFIFSLFFLFNSVGVRVCVVWCESMWQFFFFTLFCLLSLFIFLLFFFSLHLTEMNAVSRYSISYLWSIHTHTRMYKWEKFHWMWHHIIHSMQTSDSHVKYSFWFWFLFGVRLVGTTKASPSLQQQHTLHSIEMYAIYQCIASKWLILSMPFPKSQVNSIETHQQHMYLALFITNEIKIKMIFTTDCYWKFFIVIDRGTKREFPKYTNASHGICIQNVVYDISVDNHQMRLLIVFIDASQLKERF